MKSIDARIARLETMFQGSPDDPFGLDRMTTDEKQVLLIFVSRKVAQDPETPAAERQECRETIAKIEADIQAMARQQASDHYAPHLERCRADWKRKSGKDNYVPALTWANVVGARFSTGTCRTSWNGALNFVHFRKNELCSRTAAPSAAPWVELWVASRKTVKV